MNPRLFPLLIAVLGGSYEICTTTTTSAHWISPNQKVRFELRVIYEIDQQFTERQHADVADSERFDAMYKTVRKLHAKSTHLVNAQDTNREKEVALFEVCYWPFR